MNIILGVGTLVLSINVMTLKLCTIWETRITSTVGSSVQLSATGILKLCDRWRFSIFTSSSDGDLAGV